MGHACRWIVLLAVLGLTTGCSGSGGGGGGSSSGPSGDTTGSNVTLSGSLATPTTAGLHILSATDFSIYTLYCVTFTTPPVSGSGPLDADGNFALTLTGAAGSPVGCFITNTTDNSIVTALTFNLGSSSGLGDGSSGSASFPAGNFSITINFDPTTNTAIADVSDAASPGAPDTATFDPSALAGSWVLHCAPVGGTDPGTGVTTSDEGGDGSHDGEGGGDDGGDGHDGHGCAVDGVSVFLDPVQATMDGAPVYALGVWTDEATFTGAGMTEGMATPPAGVTAITTLIPDTILAGADPTAKFTGFTSSAAFDYATLTMPAADAWSFLNSGTVLTDLAWTDGWHVDADCATALPPSADPWPGASATQDQKACLLNYLDTAAKHDAAAATHHYVPRVDRHVSWEDFVEGTSDTVTFHGTPVASTPDIRARTGLLSLQLAGATAIASSSFADTHSEDGHECWESHRVNLVLVINADGSVTGWFSRQESDGEDDHPADSEDASDSVQVTFTRP